MASPRDHPEAASVGLANAEPTREPSASSITATQLRETTSDDGILDSADDRLVETESTERTASPMPSPRSRAATSPPYWMVQHSHNTAGLPVESIFESRGITMRDNESEDWQGRNGACWARSVDIPDYVVVNGSATNIGAFVVFHIRVETINGGYMNIRKRYSEFDDFRRRLVQTFPNFEAAVPPLPPKSLISKFRPPFLEKRRSALQYFLK